MNRGLDENVVERVNELRGTAWSGRTFRYAKHGRDPLSGVGARMNGGRWNPRDVLQVLDLREPDALAHVGLTIEDILDEDWTACQSVGHAAWFLDLDGVIAPSASGEGFVITAFEMRLRPGTVHVSASVLLDASEYAR